jgi:UDP-galactopyranose mutase
LNYDYLIVGAGFAGAVLAERLASQCGKTCLVIDRRDHIGGNSHDCHDAAGILLHKYGPHYFRSNSERIVEYLSQFTEWHPVEYKILCHVDGRYWQFPINLNTFEQLIGRPSTTEEMEATLAEWRVPIEKPANSEEVIISQVGWKLYEMFFKNYTRKQWKRDPKDLDASVCGRIPIRTNRDDRYLAEKFQALPKDGYTAMFERILNHPNIELRLNTAYDPASRQSVFLGKSGNAEKRKAEMRKEDSGKENPSLGPRPSALRPVTYSHLIYTGMIDEFYGFRFGPLPYRSLRFEPETLDQEFYQPAMQVNYPNDHDYTRIVEIKHATGQRLPKTTIVREYPDDFGPGKEPYYPIPAPDAKALYDRYAALAALEKNVSFVGRLATYRYYNMDQVVGMALAEFEKLRGKAESEKRK